MDKKVLAVAAFACMLGAGACSKGADKDDTSNTTTDTMTVKGTDTVSVPTTVPTTDTVVKTTTTDTLHGKAADTAKKKP